MSKNKKLDFTGQTFHAGIDVHAKHWNVSIRQHKMLLKKVSMAPKPQELANYLQRHYPGGEYYTAYEAGFCGFWIHRELTELGIKNIVINPADIPTTDKEKRRKTDRIDANKISRELENGSLEALYIPDEEHEAFRTLVRLRERLVSHRTRLKNRIRMFLYRVGKEIPSNSECQHWSKRFLEWLQKIDLGSNLNQFALNMCLEELAENRKRMLQLLRYLRQHIKNSDFHEVFVNLLTVPGVGFKTAITLYSEIIDIRRFQTFDQLCAFVGLAPDVHGTGGDEKSTGITRRRNRYLRYILIEAAWVAIRKDPALLLKYNELTKRMENTEAIVRIAKKLLSRIRFVWIHNQPYVHAVIE